MLNLDAGLPIRVAAEYFDLKPRTISAWCRRGFIDRDGTRRHITVVGVMASGDRLYRLGDLFDAERATRRNPNSHRRQPTLLVTFA